MGILRKLFGPSQDEVWTQLADELRGRFVDGGLWKGDRVVAHAGGWAVTLDTFTVSTGKSSTTYTRLVAPFENPDDFHFSVGRAHLFSPLARWLGFQDVTIGDPEFDAAFVIKTNQVEKVRAFLGHPRLRLLLMRQPHVAFEVQRGDPALFGQGLPEGLDHLSFVSPGVIKDLDQLKSLFLMFSVALRQLDRIDFPEAEPVEAQDGLSSPAPVRGSSGSY